MNLMKRMLAMLLIVVFVLVPMVSCSAQLKLPEEKVKVINKPKSFAERFREEVKIDPLFPEDPSEDDVFNILFIGHSYSTHWTDELAYLFQIAGYEKVNICNIYHSGAVFEEHWTWYQKGENVENFYINRPGQAEREAKKDVGWEFCTSYANWDAVSFQQGNRLVGATERYRKSISDWLPKLFNYMYERFPKAIYYWQQNWSHESGNGSYTLASTEKYGKWYRQEGLRASKQWGFYNTPLGSAWLLVRHDPLFFEWSGVHADNPTRSLTRRIQRSGSQKGTIVDDLSHDGDIGGGSYLNALVWFEMLTHKSVFDLPHTAPIYTDGDGNQYTLTVEQIMKLKDAAHSVVFADYGEAWYKK